MSSAYFSPFHPETTGAKGSAAFTSAATNSATIYLYKRSTTELTILDVPDGNVVYTFDTAGIDVTAVTNGWTPNIPTGDDPLYVVAVFVASSETTVTIEPNEWTAPALLSSSGLSNALVFLYQRNNTGVAPSAIAVETTYNFTTGVLAGSYSPWSQTIPESSGGRFLFITTAVAIGEGAEAAVTAVSWTAPRLFSVEGVSPAVINLTNDSVTVPANNDGSSPNLSQASTIISIFEAGEDVTSLWTITPTASTGVTGSLTGGNTYTVTGFTVDSGSVTFTATRSGYVPISATMTLSKAKAGADGTPATIYEVRVSPLVIKRTSAGTYTNNILAISAFSTVGNGTPQAYAGRFIVATSTDGVNYTTRYTSSVNQSTYNYTLIIGINFVRVQLYLAGGTTTLLDQEVVPVIDDGTNGIDGTDGINGAPAVTGFLTNESANVFAYANGIVVSYNGVSGQFRVFSGTTDISASFTLSSFANPQNLNVVYSGQTYTITGGLDANESTASLTIRATGSGTWAGVTIDKVFSLSKTTGGYEIVKTLPAIGDPRRFEGSIVFLETEERLYRFNGFEWTTNITVSPGYNPDPLFNNATFWTAASLQNGPVLLRIYRRSATAPAGPSVSSTYTFSTGVLSGLNNSWTTTVPTGTDPLWVRTAVAFGINATTDTIASTEWSPSVQDTTGSGIGTTAVPILLYRRNATTPARPSNTSTYTFATNTFSVAPNNSWTTSITETTGNLWLSKATAHNTTATDDILSTEWSAPVRAEVGKWYLETDTTRDGFSALGTTRAYALSSFISGGVTTVHNVVSNNISFNGVGQELRLRARVWNNCNQAITVSAEFYNSSNTLLSSIDAVSAAGSLVLNISQIGVVPSDTVYFKLVIKNAGGTALSGKVLVTDIKLDTAASSDMIPPSAITADKVAAGAITAAKIAVTELSAIAANVGTLTAGTIRNTADTFRIELNNGRTIVITGSAMKVTGAPFGVGTQFIEWYGPYDSSLSLQQNIDACNTNNARYYLTTTGNAYFGGSLAAGILRTSVGTSSLASNASISTGSFGSNGGIITVVLGFSAYSETSDIFYDATTAGLDAWKNDITAWGGTPPLDDGIYPLQYIPGGSKSVGTGGATTIGLERSIAGGAFTGVATLSVVSGTETLSGVSPTPGDAPGYLKYTKSYSASLTYTDPSNSTSLRNYRATITARGAGILSYSNSQSQFVSINTQE
jgi:hypothetical protein